MGRTHTDCTSKCHRLNRHQLIERSPRRMFANSGTLPPPRSAREGITTLPFSVRATDIVKHIVNVDSRFRDTPQLNTQSNFYFTLLSPIRNVLRIRITSVEFPNNYYIFTATRKNTTITILYTKAGVSMAATIVIPDGNYNAADMLSILGTAIASNTDLTNLLKLKVTFNGSTGQFTFSSDISFTVDTATGGYDRPFDYGLGYQLGFSRGLHDSIGTGPYTVSSDGCANFAGDNYLFLQINDLNCVTNTVSVYDTSWLQSRRQQHSFSALAKIILRQPKTYMAFDDYAGQHAKEFVFTAPADLTRLHIRVLDAYGEEIGLCTNQFSFSVEVLEVRNLAVYDAIRDSLLSLTD